MLFRVSFKQERAREIVFKLCKKTKYLKNGSFIVFDSGLRNVRQKYLKIKNVKELPVKKYYYLTKVWLLDFSL